MAPPQFSKISMCGTHKTPRCAPQESTCNSNPEFVCHCQWLTQCLEGTAYRQTSLLLYMVFLTAQLSMWITVIKTYFINHQCWTSPHSWGLLLCGQLSLIFVPDWQLYRPHVVWLVAGWLWPKWHSILYLVHYFWTGPIGHLGCRHWSPWQIVSVK
jgi:hypothetical protein